MTATEKAQAARMLKDGANYRTVAAHIGCGPAEVWYLSCAMADMIPSANELLSDRYDLYLDDCDIFGVDPLEMDAWRSGGSEPGLYDEETGESYLKLYCRYIEQTYGVPLSPSEWNSCDMPER